jgi:hypothetical protein
MAARSRAGTLPATPREGDEQDAEGLEAQRAAHVEQHGPVEDRHEDLDGYTVNFVSFAQDIDATPLLKGLPDDSCPCPHWGYVLEGRVTFRFTDREEVFEAGDGVGVGAQDVGQQRVELAPAALARQLARRRHAPDAVCDLGELGQLRDARRDRDLLALELARPAAPVPLIVRPAEGGADLVGKAELLGQRARHGGVARHDVVHLPVTGEGELQADAKAVQRRVAGSRRAACSPPSCPRRAARGGT